MLNATIYSQDGHVVATKARVTNEQEDMLLELGMYVVDGGQEVRVLPAKGLILPTGETIEPHRNKRNRAGWRMIKGSTTAFLQGWPGEVGYEFAMQAVLALT